jgi:hypothetical protein
MLRIAAVQKMDFPAWNRLSFSWLIPPWREAEIMLIGRDVQVINVELVGDAYAIASNYLRKSGAVSDTLATNDRLLEIIVEMFYRGEHNKLRLANRAIAKFEAAEFV